MQNLSEATIRPADLAAALRGLGINCDGLYEVHADLKSVTVKRRPIVESGPALDITERYDLDFARNWDDA